ncbi:SSI family serine proteinase inhibitor [Streptomyces bungoensis]|uniref:SSI family serine proteinase inhibitor n=1 Tax=Streptomyces bungoensis TaxID=285568 RepID=UPI00342CEB96
MVSVLSFVPRGVLAVSLAAVSSLAGLTAVPAAAAPSTTAPSPAAPLPVRPDGRGGDHLTVVVRHAPGGRNGRYVVFCHPEGGRHPDAAGACRMLDARTRWGRDTFAPVAPGAICAMVHGGPATAHVTGAWAGRPVDAWFDRRDGCEIERWNRMVPLLPRIGAPAPEFPH